MSKCISLKSEACEKQVSQQKYLVIMDVFFFFFLQVEAELYNHVADLNEVHRTWKITKYKFKKALLDIILTHSGLVSLFNYLLLARDFTLTCV
jgi:hypothetical protein